MAVRETCLLRRSQVRRALTMAEAIEAVEAAFRAYGQGRAQMPPKPYLLFPKGDLRCMPAYIPEIGFASVKNVNVHPGNSGLPTVMGTLTLFDPDTGFPVAIMDATELTAIRTAAAAAVATRYLARRDSETIAIIGAGGQSHAQLEGLMLTLPGVRRILVCDADAARAQRLAERSARTYGVEVGVASARQAASEADVLTTITPVRRPIVERDFVRPGTHINAIGADAPGKQELAPGILKDAKVVIDEYEQASHGGEINVAVSSGLIGRGDIYADIGELVAGKKPGRQSADEITVFDSTGLAIQDLACAALVYRKVMGEEQLKAEVSSIDLVEAD